MTDQPTICSVPLLYADEDVWLTHKKVFSDGELEEEAEVIRDFRITAADSRAPAGAVRGGP